MTMSVKVLSRTNAAAKLRLQMASYNHFGTHLSMDITLIFNIVLQLYYHNTRQLYFT